MGNTVRTIELVVWSREARFPNFFHNNENNA
jgi:hypothetical protein